MDIIKKPDEEYKPDFNGPGFKKLIFALLKRGKIKQATREEIWELSKDLFIQAFTHPSVNEDCNYEILEMAGDSIVYISVIQYLKSRLPACNCPAGVRILTRLKIDWVSKKMLFTKAESLGFWNFVHATIPVRNSERKSILEDVFEATLQAIFESVKIYKIQKTVKEGKAREGKPVDAGLAFSVITHLTRSLYDEIPICGKLPTTMCTDVHNIDNGYMQQTGSLDYALLVDPKTRLKELADVWSHKLGKIYTEVTEIEVGEYTQKQMRLYVKKKGREINLVRPGVTVKSASLQKDAHQLAAEEALEALHTQGIRRAMPPCYAKFCEPTPLHPHPQRWSPGLHLKFYARECALKGEQCDWESVPKDAQDLYIQRCKSKCCTCTFKNCQKFPRENKKRK